MNPEPPRSMGALLRDALPSYQAPDSLRAWALAQASTATIADDRVRKWRPLRRFAYAASFVVAAAVGWMGHGLVGAMRPDATARGALVSSLVDTHVRSLMSGHVTDVQSSDHHTVKPWFAGKVTFAPPVPELAAQGFPLVGGRLDYVAGHTAAALVYGRGLHTINLFIWPASPSDADVPAASFNGYSLVHWTDRGLSYWAVSDAAALELAAFQRAFVAGAGQ
jgi:anti-sigma factor RsiW